MIDLARPSRSALATLALAAALAALGCSDSGPQTPPIEIVTLVRGFTSPAGFDVAASDDAFLVAYGGSVGRSTGILGVRAGVDGQVLDASPFRIADATSDGFLSSPTWNDPAVTFDGATWAVAFAGTGEVDGGIPAAAIGGVLVDLAGDVGTPVALAESAQVGTCEALVGPPPAIAATAPASFAALWVLEEGCAGGPVFDRIDGALATASGGTLGSITAIGDLLPDPPIVSSAASLASSASATLATWTEGEDGAAVATLQVALLSGTSVQRSTLATVDVGFVRPAIASDGSDFLVTWVGASGSIQGARFRPGDGPLDGPAGFVIAPGDPAAGAPRVAFGDGAYLVAWTVPGDGGATLEAARVTPSGSVGDVATLATGASSPAIAVAAAGDTFLVPFLMAAPAGVASLEAVLIHP